MRYALLIMLLLLGCGDASYHEGYPYTDLTPQGYKVNIPESVYQNGLYLHDRTLTDEAEIRAQLLEWVDYRVEEWLESHPEMDRDYLVSVAQSTVTQLVDHIGVLNKYGFHGLTDAQYCGNHIEISIYGFWTTDSLRYFSNPPLYLIFTGEEIAGWLSDDYWRDIPYVIGYDFLDIGLYYLPHELNHAIGINHPL